MQKYITIMLLFLASQGLWAQPQTGSIMIQNGTVLTITDGILEDTDVLIEDGKITRIGQDLRVPRDVETIDASGLFVMPGIIDAHSHIALDAVNEGTNPVTAEVWTGDVVNPLDIGIYRALAGGVTITHALHGSANAIGGQSETLKMRYGVMNPEELKMEGAMRTIKFALGENPMRSHGEGSGKVPASRMGVEMVFRQAFSEAREYEAEWNAYEEAKKANPRAVAPAYSLRHETLVEILNGEIMIHCHSYRADEILMLMNVLEDYGVDQICFQHVNEGFKVAPELAEFGAYASVFSDWWAYKFEVYYSTAYNAAILTENDVVTSINSDSEELIRHLYHEAGKTQRYGNLTDNQALRLITINPAIQLGIEDRVGSIEVGKDGDIAIFDGHPLSVYAIPQMTFVDGILRFDRENDANDQRLVVDPEEKIDVTLYQDEDGDHCMTDVEEVHQHEH